MSGRFSSVGFSEARGEFGQLLIRAAREAQPIEAPHGRYLYWSAGAGIELWLQTKDREILDCHPHFVGSSRIRVAVTEFLEIPDELMGGKFYGWVEPKNDDPKSGLYAFAINIPDFDLARNRLSLPSVITLQIAAFAQYLKCFASDEEYYDSQENGRKFASESFIPTGLFQSNRPLALFAGHILTNELRANPVTGQNFHYLTVKTYGGVMDVVANQTAVTGQPVTGGVIHGKFWLSGRVVDDAA